MEKITNRQVLSIGIALDNLDGVDGKAYKLKPKGIYAIARNIALMQPVRGAIEKTRLGLNAQLPTALEINTKYLEFLDEESDVQLFSCEWDWLNIYDADANKDGNVIPVSVIGGLLPILKNMPEPAND